MDMRSQIDEKYAKELEAFSMTQRKAFEKIYENSHTKNAINEMILEANCTAQIHREARKSFKLLSSATHIPKPPSICRPLFTSPLFQSYPPGLRNYNLFVLNKAVERKRVNEQCLEKIKSFRAENWNKKFFGGTVQKDQYEKAFKTAQQSWATLDKEYKSNKSNYDKVRLRHRRNAANP